MTVNPDRWQRVEELYDAALARPTEERGAFLPEACAALGETDEAFSWLEAAYEQRHGYFPWIGEDPLFAPLRVDPHFEELLRRLRPHTPAK